jgi:mRNA interferase MazF
VVKETGYIPKRGDIVWVDFSPTVGHEQSGRRPALVLSPRRYNLLTSLTVVCPITRSTKGYMFEVPIPADGPVAGVVFADHVRSIDWRRRNVTFLGRMPEDVVHTVRQAVHVLIEGSLE